MSCLQFVKLIDHEQNTIRRHMNALKRTTNNINEDTKEMVLSRSRAFPRRQRKQTWTNYDKTNSTYETTDAQTLRKHAYSNILKILPPKNENFQIKNSDIFHISAQNIDCGYSLEPPRRGGSNEYQQSMF